MKLSKKIFWLLSFTWGLPMTLLGLTTMVVLLCFGYKPNRNMYGWYIEFGNNWGGADLGPICVVNKNPSQHILNHEFGHAIQNCFFGPLFPFLIAIPSAVRYWCREYLMRIKKKKYSDLPDYDAIWFEGSATRIGNEFYKTLSR